MSAGLHAEGSDLLNDLLGSVLARDIVDYDIGACLPKAESNGATDARVGPGDEGFLSNQTLRNRSPGCRACHLNLLLRAVHWPS